MYQVANYCLFKYTGFSIKKGQVLLVFLEKYKLQFFEEQRTLCKKHDRCKIKISRSLLLPVKRAEEGKGEKQMGREKLPREESRERECPGEKWLIEGAMDGQRS